MNKGLDLVYFTLFPWENPYSSVSLSFTKEFAKHNRVFYINHPYSIKDFVTNMGDDLVKTRRADLLKNQMRYESIKDLDNVIAVHPPLTLPINWLPNGMLYEQFSAYNNKIILKTIKKVIDDYQLKDFIYLNCFNPFFAGVLPKDFGQLLSIYQCIDDMTQEKYTARHGARLEQSVMGKADAVTVTSTELYNLYEQFNPNTHIVHNAVDISIYKKVHEVQFPRPKEIATIKNKIIGFIGNMDKDRINYKLMKKIAQGHRDKTLLLIGPINNTEYKEIGLDKEPNVIFTGSKNIHDLPPYVQHIDCAIIPFACNTLTKSIYPLKINEYLAGGRAIVSTTFSEDIKSFSDNIYLAANEEEFVQLIDRAIQENSPQKLAERVEVAMQNTWASRVKQVWEIVDQSLAKKTSKIHS